MWASMVFLIFLFFFSSRRRHTRFDCDWSSDVCSSDLPVANGHQNQSAVFTGSDLVEVCANSYFTYSFAAQNTDNDEIRYSFCAAYMSTRSEERRVGKECRSRWSLYHEKENNKV